MDDLTINEFLKAHQQHGGRLGAPEVLAELCLKCTLGDVICGYILNTLPDEELSAGGMVIQGAATFVEQNFDYSPAIFIRDLGYWTIMTTYGGDALVLDEVTGNVLLVETGNFYYSSGVPTALCPDGRQPVTRSSVDINSQVIAENLDELLDLVIPV